MNTEGASVEIRKLINKFADYMVCDEFHYNDIPEWGEKANHDPKDGHMEFDEEALAQSLLALMKRERIDELEKLDHVTAVPEQFAYHIHGVIQDRIKQLREELTDA